MPDGTNDQTDPTTPQAQTDSKDDVISRSEAKKAFEARDKAKKEADDLRKKLDAIEAAEKEREAKAEEERLKQAGQWDAMKQTLVSKHQAELETERKARLALEESYKAEKVEAAFHAANDLFGGHDGAATILTSDIAASYFGKYVSYEDIDVAGRKVKAIVVRDTDGNVMLDGKGNPAKFGEAMTELIQSMPNRDRILRGSGKTGSGSSGGSTGSPQPVDLRGLTAAKLRDPKILSALREQVGEGGIQMGTAYQKRG